MVKKGNTQGKNNEVIQHQNRLLVLRLIRERKVISRVELAELTGLKQATITNIINELIKNDYVLETGLIEGKNGRRVKGLCLNTDKSRILVARINSEYHAVGIYDLDANCIKAEKVFWESESSFEEMMETVRDQFLNMKESYGKDKQIIGAGVVIGGSITTVDPEFQSRLEGSLEKYITEYFTRELDMEVYVNNMSNMSGYLEWNRLEAEKKKIKTLVTLMVGYSIDCAVIFNGVVLKGKNGRAGHFGHVSIDVNGPECECGNRGCINGYISVRAVKKRWAELLKYYPNPELKADCNIRDIIKAYYSGELIARIIYHDLAEKLGVVIANLINQFNPEEVIIGDEIPNTDEFINLVRENAKSRLPLHRFEKTKIEIFKYERKIINDVGMKGMCLFVITEQMKNMMLE